MSNQQIGVNMKFTADTSQAKAQLQDLQSSLTKIMNVSRKNDPTLGFSKEIQNAINLTSELKTSLENATNVKTGQLDLSKFNDSLIKNKRTLKDYQEALTSLGPAGNQAFSNLASSIMKAEIPLKRTNKLLTDFAVTMKNTAKWQISSNIMHGLEGSIKSAYGYAQDLNKSLNDIRIVTGASVNEMARFAEQANKSARALSTTTTDYTKASLIYYQQGLSDSEVQERTDITIKMANAAGQSAQIISDQMTAVWNNFDDGSKSLEYYADVMTALGAATASSTDEIANGLEKFAAISETVGLSYEYATAALATVTDKTRQSADVVGTAFKTMFARIQGLKLGETLEDGTDLNQYSEALLAVGVNIKDANGELKDMDNILNEMAAVWETLNRDEQVALAQKVAGVRQYSQLMSLMENWDAMEINLEVANNSEGELQKQADIYAESWKAATDRVKAAAESIYQTLINDEFFIDLTNALEKVLVGVKKIMDSMGGLPGVLTLVGSIATNVFSKQLADGFDNLIYRVRMSTEEGRKEIDSLKQEASELLVAEWVDRDTTSGMVAGDAYRKQGELQSVLLANAEKLSAEEQQQIQYLMDQHSMLVSQTVVSGEQLEVEQQKTELLERRLIASAQLANQKQGADDNTNVEAVIQQKQNLKEIIDLYFQISTISLTGDTDKDVQSIQRLVNIVKQLEQSFKEAGKDKSLVFGKDGAKELDLLVSKVKNGTVSMNDLTRVLELLDIQQLDTFESLTQSLVKCGIEEKKAGELALQLSDQYDNLGLRTAKTSEKQTQLANSTDMIADRIRGAKGEVATLGTMFASTMNAITSFGFALSSIKGIIDTLNNEDLTFFEKLISVLTSASMIIGSFTSILQTANDLRKIATSEEVKNTAAKTLNTAATWLQVKAQKALNDEMQDGVDLKKSFSKADLADAKKGTKKISVKVKDKVGESVKNAGETTAKNAAVATTSLSAAFKNFVGSLKSALPFLAKFVAIAGVVIAAIAAITYAIHKGIEKYNEDAIAAKKAEQAAAELAQAYSKTKEKYEEMISTSDSYKSAREGLDNLAEGTNEYRHQLIKANDEALKLIELLGLIKGEGFDIVDGEIIINTESSDYQEKVSQMLRDTQKAQAASLMANAAADVAKNQENQTALIRKNDSQVIKDSVLTYGAEGAMLGSLLGPKGAIAGTISGLMTGLYDGIKNNIKSNKVEQEKINQLTEAYKKEGNSVFADLEKYGFNSSNEEYVKAIQKQVKVNVDGAEAIKTASQIASASLLELNKNVSKSNKKDQIQQIAEKAFEKDYIGWQKIDKDKLTSNWIGIGTEAQKEVWKQYKDTALKGLEDVKVTNYRADGGVNYTYTKYDENGNPTTEKASVSAETISAHTANEKASENILAASSLWLSTFEKLDVENNKQDAAISSSLVEGDLSKVSLTDLESFGFTSQDIAKKALEINPEVYKLMGKESAEAYLAGFNSDEIFFNTEDFITKIDGLLTPEELDALGYQDAKEYALAFKQQYDAAMAEWKGLEAFKDQSLGEAQKLNIISETLGGTSKTDSSVLDYYNKLNEEEKVIFLELDFNKEKTKENWDKAIAEIKEQKIEVEIETKSSKAAAETGLDSQQIEDVAKVYSKSENVGKGTEKIELIAEQATDAAVRYVRLQNAVLDLSENYEDYAGILKDVRKETDDVSKAYLLSTENGKKLKKSLSDLLGVSEDLIDADVVSAIDPADFKKAAAGDETAIGKIRDAFIDAQVASADFKGTAAENLNISDEAESFKSMIAGLSDGAVIDIDNSPFLTGLIQSWLMAGKTAPEIQSLLSGFNIDADVSEFEGSMKQMKTAAEGASNSVIQDLSYSQEVETQAVTEESDVNQVAWAENYDATPYPLKHTVMMDSSSEPYEVETVIQQASKSVALEPVKGTESKVVTATSSKVTNGEGDTSNIQVGGIKISNSTKSVGNKVNPNTATTAVNNLNKSKSGGGPKPAEKVKKTKKADVVERYKEITDSLDDNTKALDKAAKKADYLYGPGRIKWLKESNKLIKQQNDLLKSQIGQAKTNLTLDRRDLDKAASALDIDFIYDKTTGNILNYTTEMNKVFEELSKAEDTINSFKTKEEQDKYKEKTLQPLQDKIEELTAAQKQYDETKDLIETLNTDLEDNLRELENNKSAIISHIVELKVKVDDEDLSHLDFLISRLEAREFRTAKLLAEMQDYLGIYQSQADTAKYGMDQYLTEWLTSKEKSLFYKGRADEIDWTSKENLPDDFWDKITGYANDYREATQSAFELRTEMYDKLGSAFSDLTSEIDNTISKFDHYSQVMDSYTNIIDLSGQKNSFTKEELKEFNQLKVTNANAKLESSKDRKESYATYANDRKNEYEQDLALRADIKEKLKTAKGSEKKQLQGELEAIEQQIKLSKQAWEDAEDAALTANEEFLTSWEEALQASRDAFIANAQLELDALEEKMAGTYGSIENMQQNFDRNTEINDRYLEDYERIYELSKMTRDLDKKIDETSNIKAKKELAKLQEEILFYQEEGRKMSDYDLEYLQKKYDLRVAEIAMEEAQNAKTQVRLTRDSEGNYSYTYTADEDSMAEAQQTYEDKLYELTNLSNEYIEEQTGQLLQTQQEYLDALAEIHQKAAEGQYKTTEDYQKALDECTAYYVGKMNYHGGEIDKATMNNAIVYKSDYSNYERYVGDKLTESQKLVNKTDAQILENQKLMTVLTVEKQAALDEVQLAFAQGLIEDQDAYTTQIGAINDKYNGLMDAQQGKIDTLVSEREKKYEKDYGAYSAEAIKKEAAEEGFVTNLKDKWLPQLKDTQETGQGYVASFTEAISGPNGYLEQVKEDYDELNKNIDCNMKSAGTSTEDFSKDIKKELLTGEDSVKNSIDETSNSVDDLIEMLTGTNGLTDTATDLHNWALDVNDDIGDLIKKYTSLQTAVQNAQIALQEQSEAELEDEGDDGIPPINPPTNPEKKDIKKGGSVKASASALIYDYQGEAEKFGETQTFYKNPTYTVLDVQGDWVKVRHTSQSKGVTGWFKKSDLKAYDTGGYTGSWGAEGRLAMLHEKELVLNQQDTENMLKIVSMVRDLSAALDSQAYYSSLAQLKASQLNAMQNHLESFEQTVTIHAEFPAASSAAEIEAALSNLVNNASQYANRKY